MTKINIDEERRAQEKSVDFIAFSGGGAKGAIYAGVYKSLKASGMVDGMRAVAGSSAGAITAALIATGIEVEAFEKISKTTNLKGLLGKGFLVNKDGKPLYKLLQDTIFDNVSSFVLQPGIEERVSARLEQIKDEEAQLKTLESLHLDKQSQIEFALAEITKDEAAASRAGAILNRQEAQERRKALEAEKEAMQLDIQGGTDQLKMLEKSRSKLEALVASNYKDSIELVARCSARPVRGKIYFKDLALLREIDPVRFKDLIVTAVRRDNAELKIFSAEETPNVEIALACRASASIPLVFQSVDIDGVQYVDGGYRDNVPTKYFKEISEDPKQKGRTVALAFGSNEPDDPVQIALYSSRERIYKFGAITKFVMNVLFKIAAKVGGVFKYTESEEATAQSLRRQAGHVVALDPKGVGTLSFDKAQANADYLCVKGEVQADRYLENQSLIAPDPNFKYREFLLETLEDVAKNEKKAWATSTADPLATKMAALLSFCKKDIWQGKDKEDVLEQFIALAGVNHRTGKASIDSPVLDKLTKALNSKTAPQEIVAKFRELLGKTDVAQKFEKKDFDSIIKNQLGGIETSKKSAPKAR